MKATKAKKPMKVFAAISAVSSGINDATGTTTYFSNKKDAIEYVKRLKQTTPFGFSWDNSYGQFSHYEQIEVDPPAELWKTTSLLVNVHGHIAKGMEQGIRKPWSMYKAGSAYGTHKLVITLPTDSEKKARKVGFAAYSLIITHGLWDNVPAAKVVLEDALEPLLQGS